MRPQIWGEAIRICQISKPFFDTIIVGILRQWFSAADEPGYVSVVPSYGLVTYTIGHNPKLKIVASSREACLKLAVSMSTMTRLAEPSSLAEQQAPRHAPKDTSLRSQMGWWT